MEIMYCEEIYGDNVLRGDIYYRLCLERKIYIGLFAYSKTMINTDLLCEYYANQFQIVLWNIYIAKCNVTVTFKYDWLHSRYKET